MLGTLTETWMFLEIQSVMLAQVKSSVQSQGVIVMVLTLTYEGYPLDPTMIWMMFVLLFEMD